MIDMNFKPPERKYQCNETSAPLTLPIAGLTQQLKYDWGGERWKEATWAKVHVVATVVAYGFNVIYSDTDVSWFKVGGRVSWFLGFGPAV